MKDIKENECDRTGTSARWHSLYRIYTIFFDKSILFNTS